MKLKFKADLMIDGMEFVKGKTYTLPDWLARSFISCGYAEVPGLGVLNKEEPTLKAPAKKAPVKPAAKKKKGKKK